MQALGLQAGPTQLTLQASADTALGQPGPGALSPDHVSAWLWSPKESMQSHKGAWSSCPQPRPGSDTVPLKAPLKAVSQGEFFPPDLATAVRISTGGKKPSKSQW